MAWGGHRDKGRRGLRCSRPLRLLRARGHKLHHSSHHQRAPQTDGRGDLLEEATQEHERTDKKVRLFGEEHYAAASWEKERRVVYKAEAMQQGTNRRFVVSTRRDAPEELYEFYARRGQSENWIKDFKLHMRADRLSCHRFVANQFRLLLHACAYWLMDALRRKLIEGGSRRMQLDSLRLSLIKIGGRVRQLLTKIRLHLAWGHPGQDLWHSLSGAFGIVHE